MKQVIQSYKTGEVKVREVPAPLCKHNGILVRNRHSLISIGTERSSIELGKKSLLGKAQARPDLVRRVWEKAKKEGLLKTYQEAMGRMDSPTALGYSCAGVVEEAGPAATEFSPGDRVACVGQGFASHAEFVSVPINLACRIPPNVSEEAASFGMLGIIALHGIRSANLSFGSNVTVIGLGLLGLLTVQILRAYGCQVSAMDLDPKKVDLAKQFGAEYTTVDETELEQFTQSMTHAQGADAVIITAATKSSAPVDLSIKLARPKGKIVVVGIADIHPNRNELWNKELELVVSKAAGPGSLDPLYELEGVDFPIGEVRWTQKRNLEEFLRLLANKRVQVEPLITHHFEITNAEQVYSQIVSGGLSNVIGSVLNYPSDSPIQRTIQLGNFAEDSHIASSTALGAIGAGLFGKTLLLPNLTKVKNVHLHTLVTSSGSNAEHSAQKFGFQQCATDTNEIWKNATISGVLGLTPHNTHAQLVLKALESNKPLFLEKPLCTTQEELDTLIVAFEPIKAPPLIMVGHNRRFSPHMKKIEDWLKNRQTPLVVQCRVNSGYVPKDHWVHQDEQGRSRIVGEMTHFIDWMQAITRANPTKVHAERVAGDGQNVVNNDNMVAVIKFEDGSVGSILYSASGDKAYSREAVEIFFEGKVIRSQDFRNSEYHFEGKKQKFNTTNQELGYTEELQHFVDCIQGKVQPLVSPKEMILAMQTSFAIEASLSTGLPVNIGLTKKE